MFEKVKCSTPDFAEENVAKLLKLFPEVEGEKGEVDLDKLRQVLSSKVVEGNVERYEFTWPGKRAAKAAASAATTKTLRPCREESVNFDSTENLYIEGDNLEVLKLLQTTYAGKVKMIYIDPPYNTGKDFVYRDRFSITGKELSRQAGMIDEEGNRFEVNESSEARYHSNWCSMMYPRLKLARNLLRDDGFIFISLDDNEVVNCRKICDEIFGESNFTATIARKRKKEISNDSKNVAIQGEYLLCYGKTDSAVLKFEPLSDEYIESSYNDPTDQFPKGKWRPVPLTVSKGLSGGGYSYEVVTPSGIVHKRVWAYPKLSFEKLLADGLVYFGKDGSGIPQRVMYLSESKGQPVSNYWDKGATNKEGKKEILELFGENVFDTPKPSALIRKIIDISCECDETIIDFFSGSASTAQAVIQLNTKDGGNRNFIMVQLPEVCPDDSEAAKAGYKNICEIGKERIRRAGKKIFEELKAKRKEKEGTLDFGGDGAAGVCALPDIGFRVLKLDSSSLNDTSATASETTQEFANFNRIKSDRSPEDLLFQMLLETHIPLSDSIETKTVCGNPVFFVSDTALVACLDPKAKMTTEFFLEVAKLKPGVAFFRDDAFADDSARTNLQQAFDQFSPTTAIKVI